MVFCFPFTQALTIKLGARFIISEIIALFLAPYVFFLGKGKRSTTERLLVVLLVVFLVYSIFISIVGLIWIMPGYKHLVSSQAFNQYFSLEARAILENIRLMACISTVLALFAFIRTKVDFHRIIKIFVITGTLNAIYGIYQIISLWKTPWLPMLPGAYIKLELLRASGTLWEYSHYGSFMLIVTLLILYIIAISKKVLWKITAIFNITALFLSFSATAWIACTASLSVLIFAQTYKPAMRKIGNSFGMLIILSVAVFLLLNAFDPIVEKVIWKITKDSPEKFERLESTKNVFKIFLENPLGIGQGMYVFLFGGALAYLHIPVELGVFGIFLWGSILIVIFLAILKLGHNSSTAGYTKRFFPYALAMFIGTNIFMLNYVTLNHEWVWFELALPVVALKLALKKDYYNIEARPVSGL